MAEHPNVTAVRRGFEAVSRGDFVALAEALDGSVALTFTGRSPLAGEHQGKDAVVGHFRRLRELSGGS